MEQYLFRYIPFETLIGMTLTKVLTFVHPELWEDPKEKYPFTQFVLTIDNEYERIMYLAIYNKTYAQCWTYLAESDAMWRIYSYNNRAIRIRISSKNAESLPNVMVSPVQYKEDVGSDFGEGFSGFLCSLARKRLAFEHEKEVRLINHYQFADDVDMEKHFKAFFVLIDHPKKLEVLESLYPTLDVEEQTRKLITFLNIGKDRISTKDISFANIPDFIEGVLIHPLAPKWYEEIVKEFCKQNAICFEGQSTLYQD
jgi:hypothetical protein